MSNPSEPLPPPKEPRRNSGTLLAAIVIAVVLMAIGCAGVCGGFLYFAAPQARQAMRQANLPVLRVPGRPDPNDWMTTRTLSEIYTNSLAAIAEHKPVTDALGIPVVPDLQADEIFRNTGDPLSRQGQSIEFDIQGPDGTAVVAVSAINPESITEIIVTLEDGSTIVVPPPEPKPFVVR